MWHKGFTDYEDEKEGSIIRIRNRFEDYIRVMVCNEEHIYTSTYMDKEDLEQMIQFCKDELEIMEKGDSKK